MTLWQSLILGGGLLQLAGVVVTIIGAIRTWNRFRPDERLWAPVTDRLRHSLGRFKAWVRRRLGLTRTHHASARATASVGLSASAKGRKSYRQLPANQSTADALSELDERTRELIGRIYDAADRQDERSTAIENIVAQLKLDLSTLASQQTQETREAAAGGVRIILTGLVVTAAGIVAVTLGLYPADSLVFYEIVRNLL